MAFLCSCKDQCTVATRVMAHTTKCKLEEAATTVFRCCGKLLKNKCFTLTKVTVNAQSLIAGDGNCHNNSVTTRYSFAWQLSK